MIKVQWKCANRMGAGNKALLCAHTVDQPTMRGRRLRRRWWLAYSRPTGLWLRRVRSSLSTYTTQGFVCGPQCWGIAWSYNSMGYRPVMKVWSVGKEFAPVKSTWVADIHFILFLVSIYHHRFLMNKASSDDNSVAIVGAIVAENEWKRNKYTELNYVAKTLVHERLFL